eukprot:969641-Heterocapsa_arctica.AAC.1
MWGHQVHGTPLSRLEAWRASAVQGAGVGKRGTCATTVIRMIYGESRDPLVKARTQLLSMWVRHMAKNRDHRTAAVKFWHRSRQQLGDDGYHWNRVKGPMAATIATLIDIGWQPLSACYWGDSQGNRWALG